MTIKTKMLAFLTLIVFLLLAFAGFGIHSIQQLSSSSRIGLTEVNKESAAANAIDEAHIHFKIQVQEWKNILLRGTDSSSYKKYLDQFNREGLIVQNQLKITILLLQELGLAVETAEQLKRNHFELISKYTSALQQFNLSDPNAGKQLDQRVTGIDRPTSEGMTELTRLSETRFYQRIKNEITAVETIAQETQWDFMVATLIGLMLALAGSVLILRTLLQQLGGEPAYVAHIAHRIAADDLDMDIVVRYNTKSSILAAMKTMQLALKTRIASERASAAENQRIRFALDHVTIPVTVSDDQHALVYLNDAAQKLWADITAGRNTALLGSRLSDYFEDEATRAAYRAEMTTSHVLDTVLAQRQLRVTVSPVRSDVGVYHGRVTQWLDRTTEVTAEQEIAAIIAAAGNGNFSQRLATAGKHGFFLEVAERLNALLTIVARGLDDVGLVLNALSHGDLTQRMAGNYAGVFAQLQDNANATVDCLRDIIAHIMETTAIVNAAAQDIAAGNVNLAQRTEEQAHNLEKTVASMETLTTAVQNNADNAVKANGITRHANDIVQQGGSMVNSVVATMGTIQVSSSKIADIISVIDSIAFQTNILALNAAVEAARAGELGRGFAVVAAEVRNLAQRSAQAAKETKALIDDSVGRISEGVHLVEGTGRTMAELVASFRDVAALITDISSASREQSSDIAQMTHNIGHMDAVTQQNAALVEQAAAAAESLSEQARSLAEIVSVFQLPRTA
jgi:methyl-accepting chemotaxis protein